MLLYSRVIVQCLLTLTVLLTVSSQLATLTTITATPMHQSYIGMVLGEWEDMWVVRLLVNILGYATIIVPTYVVIQYVKRTNYIERAGTGCWPSFLRLFIYGNELEKSSLEESGIKTKTTINDPLSRQVIALLICIAGLQGSYLTWGVIQERIMTVAYGDELFKNSQFLVFMNRNLAFVFAMCAILLRPQPKHTVPLYKYSFASMSNILSSWFQYEALKYVSFPTQVLAKASKIIPVMLMGKFVSKKSFQTYEYITAGMISVGVSMFLLTSSDATKQGVTVTTFSGVMLLVGYMVFDSFTSNWQGELFTQYKMSSVQMMAGVNLFSCILTVTAMLESGGIVTSFLFMARHSLFALHVVLLSICSACGQLFIFYTISRFGPVTFVIIMTVRQAFAILLSCLIYHHPVTIVGIAGVLVVFLALFTKIYANQRRRAIEAADRTTSIETLSKV